MSLSPLHVADPLLIAGPNGGGIAFVHRYAVLPLLDESATGLGIKQSMLAWCAQDEGMASTIVAVKDGRISRQSLADTDLDLHDLLPTPHGWHVVSTGENAVLRLDDRWQVVQRWDFGGEPDAMHLNSLCVHEGRLLASAFGRFSTHREYKGRTAGAGLILDVETGETVLEGLSQPHSLASADGTLYYCDSEVNQVVRRTAAGQTQRVTLPGYTRGLWVGKNHVYVGISRSRNASRDESVDRLDSASLAVLRRDDLAVQGYVPLPWNEIYDIRALHEAELLQSLVSLALDARDRKLEGRDQQLAEIEQAHARYRGDADQAVLHLQGQVVDLGARLQLLSQEREVSTTERQGLAEQLRVSEAVRQDLDAALRGAGTDRQALAERLQGSEAERQSIEQRLQSSEAERQSVEQRLQSSEAERQAMAERLEVLETERQALVEQTRAALEQVASIHSQLEARTRELEARTRELDVEQDEAIRLRRDAELLQQVFASRSWRWSRPLRVVARMLRGDLGPDDREQFAGLGRRATRRLPGIGRRIAAEPLAPPLGGVRRPEQLLSAPVIAALGLQPSAQSDKPDVYVWAVIDWHFRTQRPQHLARALADGGHRVFYLSNNFVDRAEPGFALEPLDGEGRLYQVHLHLRGAPSIYHAPPTPEQFLQLDAGLAALLRWNMGRDAISLVQHPYWSALAERLPACRVVYDCMDHHAGFANNAAAILAEEQRLLERCDLTITSSQWLHTELGSSGRATALVRNACDYAHFASVPREVFADPDGRRVIGYYGAIAEWFDLELARAVASAFPDALLLLVGSDTAGAGVALSDLPNVRFTGEVKYADLPYWLHGFDVCLLPFKVEPLTLATNPVKVYEYLSAGKPVVAVELPEMVQFGGLVATADSQAGFIDAVAAALLARKSTKQRAARQQFAAGQTWGHRAAELDHVLQELQLPTASVVVVTYNNLEYTQACLHSLQTLTDWPMLEVIVVDNASQDGTPSFLREWEAAGTHRRVILNAENRGFAAANNQGLAAATGEYLVLLNNDTYVTRGWLRGLIAHLKDGSVALVGPVTNNIGNEARIEVNYADMDEMAAVAAEYTARHRDTNFPIRTLAFFCVAMRRDTYERIGPLDEAFGIGFFEDDDYCRRIEQAQLRCVCAEDVFIHHHLSASFDKLKLERRQQLFQDNKAIYERKWGPWAPHGYRSRSAGGM